MTEEFWEKGISPISEKNFCWLSIVNYYYLKCLRKRTFLWICRFLMAALLELRPCLAKQPPTNWQQATLHFILPQRSNGSTHELSGHNPLKDGHTDIPGSYLGLQHIPSVEKISPQTCICGVLWSSRIDISNIIVISFIIFITFLVLWYLSWFYL